jgi:hypothetical protein
MQTLLINLVDYVAAQVREADLQAEEEDFRVDDMAECGRLASPREELEVSELEDLREKLRLRVVNLTTEPTRSELVMIATRSSSASQEEEEPLKPTAKKSTGGDPPVKPKAKTKGKKKGKGSKTAKAKSISSVAEWLSQEKLAPRPLRKGKRVIDYNDECKTQPNWKKAECEPTRTPVNAQLEAIRKKGYGEVEVRESLVPGDSGCGLFAVAAKKKNDKICTYEGVEVAEDTLRQGYGDRDYVASAIRDHKTGELVYVDAEAELSCYGRFAQDPIDEHLVNAKILWREGRLWLVATCEIAPGDEIFVEYGLDYWRDRLHFLDKELRARIETKCSRPCVEFFPEVTVADFKDSVSVLHRDGLRVRSEGEYLQGTPDNLLTRTDRFLPEAEPTGEEAERAPALLDQNLLDELSFDNVEECKELADKLHFLNGRKFEDEGRLYEIWQVRYEPECGRVIGFRRPLTGTTHNEDGSAFLVYGREGLYELSEIYLVNHPEDREDTPWPTTCEEWEVLQQEDEALRAIREKIDAAGGESIKEGRNKFQLVSSDLRSGAKRLVRVVMDTRKGVLEQTMVPQKLERSTLRMHHEGFGHMGSNRMLETLRLRYFWPKMDQDIIKHTGKCINCKLRKSYQRRPKVPIMKYDDTSRPLDRVHVDLTGPLPESKGKNKYIMVIKDYLTKYVWLVPLKTKGAVEVTEAFVGEFICQAGVPGRVVSDRGNEFVNRLLSNVSRILRINRVSTTPYNPRSDGFVENHNKTLKDQLFHFVDTLKQDDWDVFLPTVQLMYNTTVSLATGYTPMLLMTGREARMPSFGHIESVDLERHKSVLSNEYILKMIETMRAYQDHALKQTVKNKARLNVRVRKPMEFVEYEVGQLFMRTHRPTSTFKSADEKEAWHITMKLLERFEGPYRIIRKISPVLYDANIDGKEVRVHANNMKPH